MARRRNAARREKTRRSERAINGSGHWSLEHGSSSPKAGFRRHAGIRRSRPLEALSKAHRICAVFTQPDRPSGRGRPLQASPVKNLAAFTRVPRVSAGHFQVRRNVLDDLRSLNSDVLVVVAYGLILAARSAAESSARLHQYSCLAAAALAGGGADSTRGGSRETRRPASPSCAWRRVSIPVPCWRLAK